MIGELVLATGNKGKIVEFQRLLEGEDIEIHSMKEFQNIGEIVENGTTFAENALIKARTVAKATGKPALADDSGLMVDALDGAPGIYSARFAGDGHDDEANNDKLLDLLKDVPDEKRTAQYFCAIAIVLPSGEEYVVDGACKGRILRERQGTGGFGYDPMFFVDEFDKTFAEVPMDEKNKISHRGIANRKAIEVLKKL